MAEPMTDAAWAFVAERDIGTLDDGLISKGQKVIVRATLTLAEAEALLGCKLPGDPAHVAEVARKVGRNIVTEYIDARLLPPRSARV